MNDLLVREILKWSVVILVGPLFVSLAVWSIRRSKRRSDEVQVIWARLAEEIGFEFQEQRGGNWLLGGLGSPPMLLGQVDGTALRVEMGATGSSGNNMGGSSYTTIHASVPHLPDELFLTIGTPQSGSRNYRVPTGDAMFDSRFDINCSHAEDARTMADQIFRDGFSQLFRHRGEARIQGYKGVKGAADELTLTWPGHEQDPHILQLALRTAGRLCRTSSVLP